MTDTTCAYEERVRAGLAQGSLDPELRDHAAACPVCRETVAVSSWMRKLRTATLEERAAGARIPAARDILELARSRRIPREIEASNMLMPLRAYRRFVLPLGFGAGIVAAVLNASSIKSLFLSLPGLRTLTSGFESRPFLMDPAAFGLLGIVAGLGLLTILALVAATGFKRVER